MLDGNLQNSVIIPCMVIGWQTSAGFEEAEKWLLSITGIVLCLLCFGTLKHTLKHTLMSY